MEEAFVVTAGRQYTIRHVLGRGAFGVVYRAVLHSPGGFTKEVAVKVLNAEASENPEIARRLRDEARLLGLVRHRAILQVDGLVQLGGRWAVVMEYVEGVNLLDLIRAAPIPLGAALDIVAEVAGALHCAYTQPGPDGRPLQLVHRDIKPANLQITAAGEVKLLDFGIARAEFDGREAETQALMLGSMAYMAPERLDMVDGPEGDVYALGAVLYQMTTQRALGKTSTNTRKHAEHLRQGMQTLAGQPSQLVELLEAMLAYEPQRRPSAKDLQRRCVRIREQLGLEPLGDWAEQAVRVELSRRPTHMAEDSMIGATLDENSGRFAPPPSVPTPLTQVELETALHQPAAHRRIDPASLAPFVAGTLAAVVLAGLGVLVALRAVSTVSPSDAAPLLNDDELAPALTDDSADMVPEESESLAATPSATASASEERPVTKAQPSVVSTVRDEARAAQEPLPGRVKLVGDARSVRLVGPQGSEAPGAWIPAGHYRAYATFDGGELPAGDFDLAPGQLLRLTCSAAAATCVAN